jgi:chromosome segregation ATPase
MTVTKYEQQTTIANEQIADAKTKIAGAQEIQRIISVRMKEIATLMARPTITAGEKSKLLKEEEEIKSKLESQQNTVDIETKNLVKYETDIATLATTIKTFKKYVKDTKEIIKTLETKVKETKEALKAPKKKDDEAPPVKGKDTEEEGATEKDEEGDDKIDEVDEAGSEEPEAVKGGNEKVDSELTKLRKRTNQLPLKLTLLPRLSPLSKRNQRLLIKKSSKRLLTPPRKKPNLLK